MNWLVSQRYVHINSLNFITFTSLTVLTSVPVSNTVPENSIPETNCFEIRLICKAQHLGGQKILIHTLSGTERFKCLPSPTQGGGGKSVVPKSQESELKIFHDHNLKSCSSPILTRTQMKISRMSESTEVHKYFYRHTNTFDPDH